MTGNSATAEALYTGGLFDGQTLVYSLLKDSNQWKLDRLDDFKEFDLQDFADAFAETAPRFTNPLTQEQASCAAEEFSSRSPNEVKAGLLSGDLEQLFQSQSVARSTSRDLRSCPRGYGPTVSSASLGFSPPRRVAGIRRRTASATCGANETVSTSPWPARTNATVRHASPARTCSL